MPDRLVRYAAGICSALHYSMSINAVYMYTRPRCRELTGAKLDLIGANES